jgi:hypothetical protein
LLAAVLTKPIGQAAVAQVHFWPLQRQVSAP